MYCSTEVRFSVTGLPLASVATVLPASSTGARPPRKLNEPLNPPGWLLWSLSRRTRAPTLMVCVPCDIDVMFVNSKWRLVSCVSPTPLPPVVKAPATPIEGISLPSDALWLRMN